MRESRTYGSVRGARGNSRPYRDMRFVAMQESGIGTKQEDIAVQHSFRY
jgi:hypothetical protein